MTHIPANISNWSLDTNELAYYVNSKGNANATSLPLYIPKLMPLIKMGKMKQTAKGLNSTCFINSSKCKVSISSRITTQNYRTIPRVANQLFGNRYTKQSGVTEVCNVAYLNVERTQIRLNIPNEAPRYLSYGDKLQVEIRNNDVDEIYATNQLDPSTKS